MVDVLVGFAEHPERPTDLNVANNNGSTPAHLAALKGHVAVMRSLHEGKADIDLANKKDNQTPLDWAIRNQRLEMVAYLKSLGFRPTPPPPPPPAPDVSDDAGSKKKGKKGKKKKK